MGGRCLVLGSTRPKGALLRKNDWDRTRIVNVSGGAIFGKPQERKFGRFTGRSLSRKTSRADGDENEPHKPDRVFEDEVKERG